MRFFNVTRLSIILSIFTRNVLTVHQIKVTERCFYIMSSVSKLTNLHLLIVSMNVLF